MNAHTPPIPVPGKDVGRLLQPVLVDLIALSLNAKQAHWHVQGRHFTQVHEQLDTLVDDVRDCADDVAERLIALDVPVDGRPAAVATTTNLPEFDQGFLGDDKVVSAIVDQIDATISRGRQALGPLDEIDQVSQDVVIELLRKLEKHRWMFAAQTTS
ncbi:Dps family protein [Actinopolymorpha alba]|uniref:Dps family protein n=1 Tax=Actinopolymorpha alba TaxID=533267 RepID=UPI0003633EC6|nr:DNA starvation/stationary phase protection protein [Actinopolymorpha alba]